MSLSLDSLHRHQGDEAKHGTTDKRNPVVNHPQDTADCRQNHGCNVVNGETHGYAGCDVLGVSNFLGIGLDGDMEIVKNLVQEVKNHRTMTHRGLPDQPGCGFIVCLNQGGAAAPSADEIAAELANLNTPLASMTFKNQFRWFEGDLPHADSQFSYTLLFQPALPFPLPNKDLIIFRPAIPLIFDQPIFNSEKMDFDGETGLGDIAFDLAYARVTKSGLMMAAGFATTLPTGTSSELTGGQWSIGPEILIGKKTKK